MYQVMAKKIVEKNDFNLVVWKELVYFVIENLLGQSNGQL